MFHLWLMRHGEADDPDTAPSDEERALTERGRNQVSLAARWLSDRAEAPTLIWHSPLRRARETAQGFAEALAEPILVEHPALAPGMSAERLLAAARGSTVTAMLGVGHQPDIGQAVRDCLGGGKFAVVPGTMFCIEFAGPAMVARGSLRWMADPAWFGG